LIYENDTDAAYSDLSSRSTRIALYNDKIVLAKGKLISSSFKWLNNLAIPAQVRAVVIETGDIGALVHNFFFRRSTFLDLRLTFSILITPDAAIGDFEFAGALYNTHFPFPVIGISGASRAAILAAIIDSNDTIVMVTVTDTGDSPWRTALFNPAWWICSILMAALGCAVFVVSAIRFVEYWRALGRFNAGVPQVVLAFEFCTGLSTF
jgi:hypothetical protein